MTKIFIDAGHGGSDPGATGNGLQEKDVTLAIALKLRDILNSDYEGHSVMLSRTTDQTLSLSQRTNMANSWGADYLVSVHINAGGGTGFESYTYNGSYSGKAETNRLRAIVHNAIVNETEFRDRGKKEANFHMVRESAMPAVLTENGFIDNAADAAALKSDAFLNKIARGHAEGLASALGLTLKDVNDGQGYIEVVVDSLWTYNTANWNDKAVIVNQGEVFTVIRDKFPVDGGYMYQIKSGLYITANPTYVRYYTK
ncbi:MAG: N-acetylmuramoyl-L-alanine amidase [Bacillota bacterium]|uniref:N-acetylmuramoyl-L-alanine amidase n=1 Tax=Virgibacillus salarius TaxID=447199 RepID=A0A941DW37_9BACI|nr:MULTISPECIES: N-acetylmuramoyl-L-alanine amidase [Bacillaceae]NAZ10565.1 N-acetylmuramoyl-L-alanine amidase [Agaribacter marinus]MBR7797855.1 N-acetylmuramoyl-L-alanine amidase [Virgibacillus salarius]MCC2251964.1 N-acetylmuramoyl-L-alanine amidase [Virgibacillus sp. AGTR]MDY7046193.1 N-acetylmuramoyl-L-alanine amidase [Virgibacillus sp. M23]QRZ19231.1 N-acetylmuramoyl-L-alanine amidase [Virgibacillus sp. AGTR]